MVFIYFYLFHSKRQNLKMAFQHHYKTHQRTFLKLAKDDDTQIQNFCNLYECSSILKRKLALQKIKILENLIKCLVEINFFQCFRIFWIISQNLSNRTHSLVFVRGIQKFLSFHLFSECKTSALSPPPPLFKEKNQK